MKKYISVLIVVTILVSLISISVSAYGWDDPDIMTVDEAVAEHEWYWEEKVATNRYYFLMPNGKNGDLGDDDYVDEETGEPLGRAGQYAPTWYNDYTDTAGIYWRNSGVADPPLFIGYLPSGIDDSDPNIYYADVPRAVNVLIWNNGVDGYMDESLPGYSCAAKTVSIPCEYYDPGESKNYPNGTKNFDNMIYVIDPDLVEIEESSKQQECGGEWYYYYGNGCYGFTKNGTEADCLRDDHYDAGGNHVIPEVEKPQPTPPETTSDDTEPETQPNPEFVFGDIDGDSEVTVVDATRIQRCLASIDEADVNYNVIADIDKDSIVSIMDATLIQRFVAKLIDKL